jgi:hypothetical protein
VHPPHHDPWRHPHDRARHHPAPRRRLKTWSSLGQLRRFPGEYEIVTHNLNYTTLPLIRRNGLLPEGYQIQPMQKWAQLQQESGNAAPP